MSASTPSPVGAWPSDTVAWVTDGSTPIGAAVVARLLDEGLVVAYGTADPTTADPTTTRPGLGVALPTDAAAVAAAHARIVEQAGPVTSLICTSHHREVAAVDSTDDATWLSTWQTNVLTAVRASRLVVPGMRAARSGSIVAVASTAANRPWPGSTAFAASQGALVSWTHALAADVALDQVRVNAVLVGETTEVPDPSAAKNRTLPRRMLPDPGSADDAAAAVVFLAGPDATFVTSTILPVDSGLLGVAAQ